MAYELVQANLDERLATEAVIDYLSNCDIFADKGFLGFEWQTNNLIWTPKRKNQQVQNPKVFDRWLSSGRESIEGVFMKPKTQAATLNACWQKQLSVCAFELLPK